MSERKIKSSESNSDQNSYKSADIVHMSEKNVGVGLTEQEKKQLLTRALEGFVQTGG